MTNTMKLKNKKGFTLTELIVVIVIIGILAAVLIPSLTGYITKAKQSAAEQDAQNIAREYEYWYAEYLADSTKAGEFIARVTTTYGSTVSGNITPTYKNTNNSNGELASFKYTYKGITIEYEIVDGSCKLKTSNTTGN